MNEKICELIRKAREEKKLTQKKVAELLNVNSPSTILNWEKGVAEPSIDSFVELCKLYDKDFCELLRIAYGETCKPKIKIEVTKKEFELLQKYRELDDGAKSIVMSTLNQTFDVTVSPAKKNNYAELA